MYIQIEIVFFFIQFLLLTHVWNLFTLLSYGRINLDFLKKVLFQKLFQLKTIPKIIPLGLRTTFRPSRVLYFISTKGNSAIYVIRNKRGSLNADNPMLNNSIVIYVWIDDKSCFSSMNISKKRKIVFCKNYLVEYFI